MPPRKQLTRLILALIVLIFFYLPIYDAIKTSLTPYGFILQSPPSILPQHPTISEYVNIITSPYWVQLFANTTLYGLAALAIVLPVSGLAAYGLSRYRFLGRTPFMFSALTLDIISLGFLILPLLQVVLFLGLYNSYQGMILIISTSMIPFGIWTLKGFFDQIPKDMEDAAKVDGASSLRAFYHVLLPLAAPGLITTGAFVFISAWSSAGFLPSLILVQSPQYLPVVTGIYEEWAPRSSSIPFVPYNTVMAASLLAAIPGLVLFLILEKRIAQGLLAGALK